MGIPVICIRRHLYPEIRRSYIHFTNAIIISLGAIHSGEVTGVPESLQGEIKKYNSLWNKERLKVGYKWQGENHEFLFCSWNGKPMYPTSITTWWRRFKKNNGLPDIRFHDLRHISATLLINSGVHAKIISARLGHADIRTTMNIYGHVLQQADTAAAEKFEGLFGTNKKMETRKVIS